ncbi:MAG TPA: hypothetical protein VG206_10210 [Terriglobia bacterium]|nr:hypothetical protein [Terriglobia bacterium]
MRTYAEKQPEAARQVAAVGPAHDQRQEVGTGSQADSVLRLQRTLGNRAVQRMLQARADDQRELPAGAQAWFDRPQSVNDARGEDDGSDLLDQRDAGVIARQDGDGGDGGDGAIPASAAPPAPAAPARPKPINVRNGPSHAPIDSGDRVGMSIAITISSSSGVDADMAGIQDSEKVGLSENHTGSMVGMAPLPSSQSGFMAGFPIPDDQHGWSKAAVIDRFDNNGGAGSFEKEQLDVFTDAAGGVTTPTAIPSSGYIIKREFSSTGGTAISLKTSKRAADVSVGGFSSTAGPSATQSDTVVVRA